MTIGKAPAMQFYVTDWTADTNGLSPAAKGAWIQILCKLHLAKLRGRATRDLAAWARVIGCQPAEADRLLHEIRSSDCANVTFRDAGVTVVSRRMERERKKREADKLRQRQWRATHDGHKKVTIPSSSSSSTASSSKKIQPPISPVEIPENLRTPAFEAAWGEWLIYRKQIGKTVRESTAKKQLSKLSRAGPIDAVVMIEESIGQGWTGLFEVKDDKRSGKSTGTDYSQGF